MGGGGGLGLLVNKGLGCGRNIVLIKNKDY